MVAVETPDHSVFTQSNKSECPFPAALLRSMGLVWGGWQERPRGAPLMVLHCLITKSTFMPEQMGADELARYVRESRAKFL